MEEFIRRHAKAIRGVLCCFDRMLFRGYLPIMSGYAMTSFLQAKAVDRWSLKAFLLTQAARLKKHRYGGRCRAPLPVLGGAFIRRTTGRIFVFMHGGTLCVNHRAGAGFSIEPGTTDREVLA
jgi:hypothetical protein